MQQGCKKNEIWKIWVKLTLSSKRKRFQSIQIFLSFYENAVSQYLVDKVTTKILPA